MHLIVWAGRVPLSNKSSVCRRHLPYFYEGLCMSTPGRSMMTYTTETRLEPLDSSACVDIASLHVMYSCRIVLLSFTLWPIPTICTPLPRAYNFTPFSQNCNIGHGLDTLEGQTNGMLILPIFLYIKWPLRHNQM